MKFIQDITDFIFVEDEPQKADIIFIPGGNQGAIEIGRASCRERV